LENQSRRRNGARLSATILILTGIGSSKALCNVRSAASTMRARICLRDSMRSAHCLSTRRWTLNGYMAVIRATPLTPLRENKSSGICVKSRRLGRFHAKQTNAGHAGHRVIRREAIRSSHPGFGSSGLVAQPRDGQSIESSAASDAASAAT
jgi:hypothetical protein